MSGSGQKERPAGGDDLVALLYGELPPDEERAARARIAGDPALAADLAGFERVRGLYRGLAEEEPPPALSAQLLARAAERSAPGSAGFWSRLRSWLAPIAAHPGLAAAASVILMAGIGGVLLLRKGGELTSARERAASDPVLEQAAPPPAAPPESAAAPAAQPAPSAAGSGSAEAESAEAPAEESPQLASPKSRVATRRPVRPDREKKKVDLDGAKDDSARDGPVLGLKDEMAGAEETANRTPPPASADKERESQAPAPAEPAPAQEVDQESPADLHRRAVSAAANRRCLQVQTLGLEILRLDPTYHEKEFLGDKRLTSCLAAGRPAKKARSK